MSDENYLLNKRVKIYQPEGAYHASTDAVWLAAAVEMVKNGDSFLDVGAGTGAVSLCLAERFKKFDISLTGLEIQPILCEAANKSAQANGFDFVRFINTDIFKSHLPPCSFTHVISNPPYAAGDTVSPNPSKAAAHNFSTNGLASWIAFCIKMIRPKGFFYMINRAEALDEILACLHGKLGRIEIFPIYSKTGETAKRIIVRAQKDSKVPLAIRPPVVIHSRTGSHTRKAEQVLRKGSSI